MPLAPVKEVVGNRSPQMQQRYYDPQIGRFLAVDSMAVDTKTGENFNRYWYANDNPYKFTDPDGRQITFMVNNNTPITGTHSGWIIERNGVATIYDPSGSYGGEERGTGGILEEKNRVGYIMHQLSDGTDIHQITFDTTPAEEAQILGNAMEIGDPRGFECTLSVTGSLQGVPRFLAISVTLTPSSFLRQLEKLRQREDAAKLQGSKSTESNTSKKEPKSKTRSSGAYEGERPPPIVRWDN